MIRHDRDNHKTYAHLGLGTITVQRNSIDGDEAVIIEPNNMGGRIGQLMPSDGRVVFDHAIVLLFPNAQLADRVFEAIFSGNQDADDAPATQGNRQ